MNRWRKRKGERGAVAIVVALSMVALLAAAAIGVDIAKLVYERQQLQNALDAAAAAGAQQLPTNPLQAIKDAEAFASDNMVSANLGSIVPDVALRCVVAYNERTKSPDWTTVSTLCGISSRVWDPLTCDEVICSVPCTTANTCNTIVVKYNKTVDYSFGPTIGIATGQTGTLASSACRGFCGKVIPNPMNVVVMADRTASMSSADIDKMRLGITGMLTTMTRDQQYVAFGAIHKSIQRSTCATGVPGAGAGAGKDKAFTTVNGHKTLVGDWVATDFSNTYTTGTVDDGTLALASDSDDVVHAVHCMQDYGGELKTGYKYPADANGLGTHLASALKGAARTLLGKDPNNIAQLDKAGTRADLGTPRNVIILETDGRPEELWTSSDVAKTLDNPYDIANTNGAKACQNLLDIATMAKKANIRILTIGYGNVNTFTCNTNNTGPKVRDVLAAAASETDSGAASQASSCDTQERISAENRDGDWYFCAATGADLKEVFRTAMGSITGHGRLMKLPGIN